MFSRVASQIANRVYESGVQASVVLADPATGEQFDLRGLQRLKSASLIKLPILWDLFARAEEGSLNLSETIVVPSEKRVDGGLLHKFSASPTLRLEDLAVLAGTVSDNTAANLLMDRLGLDGINDRIRSLGMKSTSLERRMLDSGAAKAGKDNWMTACDVALFLSALTSPGKTAGLSEAGKRRIIDILSTQKLQSKLAGAIPCDDVDDLEKVLAHKTGELPGHEHDAGIFFPFGPRPAVLVVLTTGLTDRLDGVRFCSALGRLVYDEWKALQPS